MIRPKSCTVCGARTLDGAARCPLHQQQAGRRLRPCLVCSAPSAGNYCPAHNPQLDEDERNARNPYRRHYRDPQYAKNRQHRYERARGRCEACGCVLEAGKWQCDHLLAISRGGTNDIENLRVLCLSCHKIKTREDRRS